MLLLSLASLVVAPIPPGATFGEWTVACDNARYCEAIALPPEDGSETGWTLYVSRRAEAASPVSISIEPVFGRREGAEGPIRLLLDGRRSDFGWEAEGQLVGDSLGLLAAVAAAREVRLVNVSGKDLGVLPVAGASAALRWIDDRQKRAGTTTALIARGNRPAADVPPPPPLPRIAQPPTSNKPPRALGAGEAKAIRALAGDVCNAERAEATTHRLDARHTVGIVGCLSGAYQGSSLVVVIDENGKWEPAPIEQPESPDEHWEPYYAYLLTEADYGGDARLLFMAAKGRGLADCGSSASWAWDGTMFRLASYRALRECRGAPPGTWLSRWQTANDPLKD